MTLPIEWQDIPISLTKGQSEIASKLYPFLKAQAKNNDLASDIIYKEKISLSLEKDKAVLQDLVIQHFKPLKNAYETLRVLSKVRIALNAKLDLNLPQLSVPSFASPVHNPFSCSNKEKSLVDCLQARRQIEQCFSSRLILKPEVTIPPLFRLGALITSSIIYGALLHSDLIIALIKSLMNRPHCFLKAGEQVAIQLSLAWRGEPASEWRLFYPDAMTEALFVTFPSAEIQTIPTDDNELKRFAWKAIKQFLISADLPKDKIPHSLNALINESLTVFDLKLPPILSSYASRRIISHSLKPHVVARLFGERFDVDIKAALADMEISASNSSLLLNVDDLSDVEPSWLYQLRDALRGKLPNDALVKLDGYAQKIIADEAYAQTYFNFAKFLLSNVSANGNKLTLKTINMYVVSVSRRLGCRLGQVDPSTLSLAALESLYLEILEDDAGEEQLGLRRSIARALREFHHFLNKEYGVTSINANATLGIGRGLMPVDANIMSYDEFHQFEQMLPIVARQEFSHITQQQELVEVAYLIALLGHRCGLRRSEALMLQHIDFCDGAFPELLIRPTEYRRLKSSSSRRKVPLYALLEQSEVQRFRAWTTKQRKQQPDGLFIFSIPELSQGAMSQDLIFNLIHRAMRDATGDESLRFHHLRHSFACWSTMRLLLSNLKQMMHPFNQLPMTSALLAGAKEFRIKLYGSSDPTRRSMYAVASLLGHSGPDMSEEHYIHMFDWLLRIFINHDKSILPKREDLIAWTNIPNTTKYEYKKKTPEIFFLESIYKYCYPNWVKALKKNKLKPSVIPQPHSLLKLTERTGIFDLIDKFLFMYFVSNESMEQCLEVAKFQPLQASVLFEAAQYVSELVTNNGGGGTRHRAVNVQRDKITGNKEAVPVFRKPIHERDLQVLALLSPKFIELIRTQRNQFKNINTFYIKNQWKTKNEAIFEFGSEIQEAKDFYQCLIGLGLVRRNITFISYDSKERSSFRNGWKKALELSNVVFTKNKPPNRKNKRSNTWLGIRPVFNTDDASKASEGSISFRYLMVMSYLLIQMDECMIKVV
jgi:integrase